MFTILGENNCQLRPLTVKHRHFHGNQIDRFLSPRDSKEKNSEKGKSHQRKGIAARRK